MAERDTGPEPDGGDRLGSTGVPAEPVSVRQDGVPRQMGAGPAAGPGLAPTALSDHAPLRVTHRHGQQAADLRRKLNEKAAATDELREALDELRQVLDVDNPPPSSASGRRRTRLLLVVGVLVIAALVLWMFLDHGSGSIVAGNPAPRESAASVPALPTASAPSAAAASGASGASAVGGTAAVTSAPPQASVAVRPLPWPGGAVVTPTGLVAAGPGASVPGTDVQVAVDADGIHLDVFERLVLDAPSADPLALAAPTLPALSATTRVQDLQVQLDDTAVLPVADGPTSWTATPPDGGDYSRVTLRYRMANGVTMITPAAPGRSLGIVTPLTAMISAAHGHAVQVRANGPGVLGVSCPTAPHGAVCGARTAGGWIATIPADSQPMVVLLQLNAKKT